MKPSLVKSFTLFQIFLSLMTTSAITYAQTSIGVRAGINLSNVKMESEDGDENNTKSLAGFNIGLTVELPVVSVFYLQSGVLYSSKGFKQKDSWFSGAGNALKVTVSYVEVPVNILYKPKLGPGKLLVGAGPYIGYGTGGKWKSDKEVVIGDIVTDDHGDVIFKNDVMNGEFGNFMYGKPWDFGANFLLGYEFLNKFTVQLNYQLGIKNLEPEVDGEKGRGKISNRGSGLSVGYKF